MTTIQTAYGRRTIDRVVGCYVSTLPQPNEPHGAWWTLNPQRGYVGVPSNARGLLTALAESRAQSAAAPSTPEHQPAASPDPQAPSRS